MQYKKNSNKTKINRYEDYDMTGNNPGRPPKTDGSGNVALGISYKSLKNLPKTPVSIMVDPYTAALPGSQPYPLLNVYNKTIGGNYAGDRNLDGGSAQQYANSVLSKFLHVFDSAVMEIGLNYRYLPVLATDTKRGFYLVDEMRKAIAEASSTLAATTFTSQNLYFYGIETNLPMGSAVPTYYRYEESTKLWKVVTENIQPTDKRVYTNIEDVIYAMCIEYQLILQSVALAFNQFNSNRSKMGEMIRMSWNRQTPTLNALFGLLKKKSFLSLFDSIAYAIEGEYLDREFMIQSNIITSVCSRRSESMNDPLMEIVAHYNMPTTFNAWVTDADKTSLLSTVYSYENDMKYTPVGGSEITFYEAVTKINGLLSANYMLEWARTVETNGLSDNALFNRIKTYVDVISICMTIFKTSFNDLRSILDIMARSGVNQWEKGVKLKVTADTDMVIPNNLIVNNIYSLAMSGQDRITFNNTTKRWSGYTLWNIYYGIPEHDTYAGGCFLSFSTKELDNNGATDTNIGYLPIAFTVINGDTPDTGIVRAVNRLGTVVEFNYSTIVMSQDARLSRLVPLSSQSEYTIRIPNIINGKTHENIDLSFCYRLMQQMFGLGAIPSSKGSDVNDISLDSDIISVYDYEIEDFTNEVITYARSKGPFVANAVDTSFLGFYGIKPGK